MKAAQSTAPRHPDAATRSDTPPVLGYDPELGPGYFVQTRTDFLRWPDFSPTFKVLYQVLCSYAAEGSRAWPGQARLAVECGVSERTIRTVLDELVAAGLLTIKQQGLNKPNLYYIHKLPTLPPKADRQNLPVRTGKNSRSRPADSAGELHTDQIHPEEIHPPPPTPSAHIPSASPEPLVVVEDDLDRVKRDTQMLVELGIAEETAQECALLAIANGRLEGYVEEQVAYVQTAPGVQDPAAVLIANIRKNTRRRPVAKSTPRSPTIRPAQGERLDSEKYLQGKYAHLFGRARADTASVEE